MGEEDAEDAGDTEEALERRVLQILSWLTRDMTVTYDMTHDA